VLLVVFHLPVQGDFGQYRGELKVGRRLGRIGLS
jgi:hypothetical protein